jgi:hypothetical protein
MTGSHEKTYWVQIFNKTTWQEFLDAGGKVPAFVEKRWAIQDFMKPGDVPFGAVDSYCPRSFFFPVQNLGSMTIMTIALDD